MSGERTEVCPPGEIRGWSAIVLWGIPAALVVAGGVWSELYLWLAPPAFAVMGIALLVGIMLAFAAERIAGQRYVGG